MSIVIGWTGGKNPIRFSMEKSVDNSTGITRYFLIRADANKGVSPAMLAMYNEFKVPAEAYLDKVGDRTGDESAQVQLTGIVKVKIKEMAPNLKKFNRLVLDIYEEDSDEYKLIWGKNRNRFYNGSFESRIEALTGLAAEMTTQAVPLGATAVLNAKTELLAKYGTQQTRMNKVDADTAAIISQREYLIKLLFKCYGVLIQTYGLNDNAEELIQQFFPLNLMGNRIVFGHHQLLVPMGSFRRVCIRTFKKGDTIEVLVIGGDVWLALTDNSDNPVTSGYLAKDGMKAIITPEDMGDIADKFVMATNVNLTKTVDLIFNIIKAK